MPHKIEVDYEFRIVADSNFFIWLSSQEDAIKRDIKLYMMHIKASSIFQRGKHNLILPSSHSKVIKDGEISEEDLGAFVKLDKNISFITLDEMVQVIKYSTLKATYEEPHKVCILTSPDFEEKYQNSEHFKSSKGIIVKSNQLAIEFLKSNYDLFKDERQKCI